LEFENVGANCIRPDRKLRRWRRCAAWPLQLGVSVPTFLNTNMKSISSIKNIFLSAAFALVLSKGNAQQPAFSTAGFYAVPASGREVYNFNVGWKFYRGSFSGAEAKTCNDKNWDIVSLPHTVQLLPEAASGGKNYQGAAWYRKYFHLDNSFVGKKIWLHFEAIMGKAKIYVNGKLITEHLGGFLPIIINLSDAGVVANSDCEISVCADNSDDPTFPPGKPQAEMDFCYMGGIYRDCWLYTTSDVHITDANYASTEAGGGVFVSYDYVNKSEALVRVKTQVKNEGKTDRTIVVKNDLSDIDGNSTVKAKAESSVMLKAGESKEVEQEIKVSNPVLWHPDHPNLQRLTTSVSINNKVVDAISNNIGIRSIEFVPNLGLSINGEIFKEKLLGVNRHQDYGYIGMALTNNLHYSDVKKMRDAGVRIIRSAHYPQDPAFMDACDQLGMFIIVATPGWQFWNDNGTFEKLVLTDIKNMVRRDRNHPSVLMWEPILNETHFPADFARKAYETVHSEYPAKGCYAACDEISKGSEMYDVLYAGPKDAAAYQKLNKCCFTREFGDCVDDWYSHNSYSRVERGWSEQGLIFQAQHYAKKNYEGSLTIDQIFKAPAAHIGGALWHSFDHQRGYHPDPFYGGIMDEFRQPKYSYYMFQSQRDASQKLSFADSGPMIFIANAMTPISPSDVVVYTNCDSVRLVVVKRKEKADKKFNVRTEVVEKNFYTDTLYQPVVNNVAGLPNEPVTFKNAFDFVTIRALFRANLADSAQMIAEGIINGKVVARQVQMPSKRSDLLKLRIDNAWYQPVANGSDIVQLVVSITDTRGYVKQLANDQVEFKVQGEGEIIGDYKIGANPVMLKAGTAPLLIRTTTTPGKVKVVASVYFGGTNSAMSDTLEFETKAPGIKLLYKDKPVIKHETTGVSTSVKTLSAEERKQKNKKVEADQKFFESTEKKH
jgi:beta-galactosidase